MTVDNVTTLSFAVAETSCCCSDVHLYIASDFLNATMSMIVPLQLLISKTWPGFWMLDWTHGSWTRLYRYLDSSTHVPVHRTPAAE